MTALYDLKEELSMVSRALSEWRRGQNTAGDAEDDQGARLEEELKGVEESEEEQGPEEAKGEEAQNVIRAEAGPECEEDIPGHEGTTRPRPRKDGLNKTTKGEQLGKDRVDALCSVFIREGKMINRKGGTIRKTATLHGVQLERIVPQRRRSPPQFNGQEDREITSVKLVFERKKCTIYKLEGGTSTKLGGFHADHFTILRNGFKMTLETEMTPDGVDEGRRPGEKREGTEEAPVVSVTLPQEQQKE
ncbi:uncharacterized protein LOC125044552 [Penaeus chinensis]|uniref:uncharacterized protein LOC125044552 n=1 Tax=Penaeus chinensis TaxID=139456 RepID=UPI001FB5BB90|nr:uncharacterized protein LOC125044552 [Penaeus chinensis]